MTGKGISYGSITVLNAIPTGMGGSVGIDLKTIAEFIPKGEVKTVTIVNNPNENTKLAEICVKNAFETMKRKEPLGWNLTINSEIPIAKGLNSSNSICNAILHAVFNEYGFRYDSLSLVKLGVACAREAEVTVTGSFDSAYACEFGGLVLTDNENDEVIVAKNIDDQDVVLYIPEEEVRTADLKEIDFSPYYIELHTAGSFAEFFPFKAMNMNGRIIAKAYGLDNSVAEMAMREHAMGAGISGNGPAVAIVLGYDRGRAFIDRTHLNNTILTKIRRTAK